MRIPSNPKRSPSHSIIPVTPQSIPENSSFFEETSTHSPRETIQVTPRPPHEEKESQDFLFFEESLREEKEENCPQEMSSGEIEEMTGQQDLQYRLVEVEIRRKT